MKLAIPDLISNSYFPALAAAELGFFEREGLDVTAELIFPVDRAYEALRDGSVDFVGGAAHGALAAFTEWRGVKLLGALAQGMYWFLVMRKELGTARGDLAALKGRRIGAAPWVEMGLRGLLTAAGLDPRPHDIRIGPVPGATGSSVNFGLTAAQALERGEAGVIAGIVQRDLPFYNAAISEHSVAVINDFGRRMSMLDEDVPYSEIVAVQFRDLWRAGA